MNLDDIPSMKLIDQSDMLGFIQKLPDQLMDAWNIGTKIDFSVLDKERIKQVVICGAGSAMTAAKIIHGYLSARSPIAIFPMCDIQIPAWALTRDTLVLICGSTGDTPILLENLTQVGNYGCQITILASDEELIQKAVENGIPYIKIIHSGPARTAIGFQFVLPLIVLNQLGLTAISETEINHIAALLKQIIQQNDINIPVVNNPAKRMAGQFLNRWVTLFGAGSMAFVAERWKSQTNENAKAWAQVEKIPDLCFSTLGGLNNPGNLLSQMMTFFIDSPFDHPTNQMISEEARRMFMVEGFNTDRYLAQGDTELECLWSAILFGDFVSYYLAMAYEVDPTPVPGVEEMLDLLNHMD